MFAKQVPSLGSVAMLLSRCSEVQRISEWTHRIEADIVALLIDKGGTLSKDVIQSTLPYKRPEVNTALKWMIFSGVLKSGRRAEVTLVEL